MQLKELVGDEASDLTSKVLVAIGLQMDMAFQGSQTCIDSGESIDLR
jgi:hypothetical protein